MKELSCGIVLVNNKKILGCIPFAGFGKKRNRLDIPKGHVESFDKDDIETAIREAKEETGLIFSRYDLNDLGTFMYTKSKNLHLFLSTKNVDIKDCCCTSFFEKENASCPEVIGYRWEDNADNFYLVLKPILEKIIKENI